MGDKHFAKAKVSLELSKSCVEVKRDGVACMYEQNIYIVIQALVAALLAIKGGLSCIPEKLPTCGLKIHGLSVTCGMLALDITDLSFITGLLCVDDVTDT